MKTALLALFLFLLAACGSETSELPPVGQDRYGNTYDPEDFLSRHAVPNAPADSSAETVAFLATTKPHFPGVTDEELIGLGQFVCDFLDRGVPDFQTVVMVDRQLEYRLHTGPEQNGALTGAAVVAFCPEYLPLIEVA